MENKTLEKIKKGMIRGLAGLVLGASISGCMMTPTDVENFMSTGSFRDPPQRQYVEIDGQRGVFNEQGLFLVPTFKDKYYYVYYVKNGHLIPFDKEIYGISAKSLRVYLKD